MQSRLSRGPAVRIVSGYHCVHFSSRREPSTAFLAVPGDAGRVSSTQTIFSGPKRSPCVGTHRQHSSVFLCKPPGRSAFTPLMQAGAFDPCVVPGQVPLAESSLYSWASQYGSRHPVECPPEGAQLIASGLSTEVAETILQFRAPSTRKLYALKWKLFTSWCGDRQLDPVNCPIGTVMEFLQARFSAGLTHSTLRVYVAAIAAYHAPLGGQSVGKDPLVAHFLHGVMRFRP